MIKIFVMCLIVAATAGTCEDCGKQLDKAVSDAKTQIALLQTPSPATGAPAPGRSSYTLIWPFSSGTWKVTQGYHSSDCDTVHGSCSWSHSCLDLTYPYDQQLNGYQNPGGDCLALDLVNVAGPTAGAALRAPVTGTVSYVTNDGEIICIDANDGRSVKIAHLTGAPAKGTNVVIHDTSIGKLKASPLSSGTGPHLHMSIYQGKGCLITGSSAASVRPFAGAYRVEGGPDFPLPPNAAVVSGGYHKDETATTSRP